MHESELACSQIVYRAAIRRSYITPSGDVHHTLFLRRPPPADTDGLSVGHGCTPAECAREFNKCKRVCSLHVGSVRDMGLDILPDSPTHANIVGLPLESDDEKSAMDFATDLAEHARIIELG